MGSNDVRRDQVRVALTAHLGWLSSRCRAQARAFPEVEADDLLQQVLEGFLDRVESGWFDQEPHVSLQAQIRNLLGLLVRNKGDVRSIQRARRLRGSPPPAPDGEEGDVDCAPTSDRDPEQRLRDRRAMEVVLHELRSGVLPSRVLAVLAVRAPELLRFDDVARVVDSPSGWKPARSAEEIWALWEAVHASPPDLDQAAWARLVAEILCCTGPLGTTPRDQLRTVTQSLNRAAARGAADLRAL